MKKHINRWIKNIDKDNFIDLPIAALDRYISDMVTRLKAEFRGMELVNKGFI